MMARLNPLIMRLKAELAADKKRAVVLGVLMLVFLVVFGRLLLNRGGSTPVTAQAVVVATVAPVGPVTSDTGNAPGAVVPSVRPSLEAAPTAEPVSASPTASTAASPPDAVAMPLKPVEIEPGPKSVRRDLFASSAWSSFPSARKTNSTQPASEEGNEEGFWGRLAAGLSEHGHAQRDEILRTEKLAQELRLQATMSGTNPTAYISGQLVRVGDTIKSFSVVAIEDRAVTIALDGHLVTLRIP